jgi:hypothetical protein
MNFILVKPNLYFTFYYLTIHTYTRGVNIFMHIFFLSHTNISPL